MAIAEKGWKAEEESHTWDGDSANGLGNERASAGAGIKHACAYCFWVYLDGGRGEQDRGDCFRPKG